MSNIIEHNDKENGDLQVGESKSLVPIKIYQDIYHQITGRTEQIRKRYSENLLLDFQDLEQIHYKINQLCDVHTVVARNDTVTVFHDKERKEQFTSFDRFRAYNVSAASPCVNVVLKYNFSITPAGIKKPQEYVITIRLSSRVALLKQAELDAPSFLQGHMVNFLTKNTAEITVEYVDYVIARGFIEAFDEWIRSCNCSPKLGWLIFFRRWSHVTPSLIKLMLVILIAWYALQSISGYFGVENSPEAWARFLILYSAATYILLFIGNIAADIIEEAIDTYPTLSYLKLNKGDENLIRKFSARRNKSLLKFILGAILTVILGVVSTKLERLISN